MLVKRKRQVRVREWGGGGIHASQLPREEKKGGWVPCIPESQVTNTQTGKGGNETDGWKTSGVEGWRYKAHTSLPASQLQCCETQLSAHAAYTFAQLTGDSLRKCCVKSFTLLLLPHYVYTRQNISFHKICTYIKCTWQIHNAQTHICIQSKWRHKGSRWIDR